MKLLITGGCGFMGTNLASHAMKNKYALCVLDNLSRQGGEKNLSFLQEQGEFKFVYEDIISSNAVEKTIEQFKPDAVIHLAGQVAMTTSVENPLLDFNINALGTLNVLEGMRKHCPGGIVIYSSTNKVYGELSEFEYIERDLRYDFKAFPDGVDEKMPLSFSTPYGCSKGAADQYVLDYSKLFNLRTVVFRHSSAFGLRQFSTFDQGWIGWFVRQAIETKKNPNRKPFTISGNGKQVRDVLFSQDLVNCYFAALKHIDKANGHVFNIGGGMRNSISLLELFDFLEKTLSIKLNFETLSWRQSDQKVYVSNIEKVKKYLDWHPEIDAWTGIKEMIAWEQKSD